MLRRRPLPLLLSIELPIVGRRCSDGVEGAGTAAGPLECRRIAASRCCTRSAAVTAAVALCSAFAAPSFMRTRGRVRGVAVASASPAWVEPSLLTTSMDDATDTLRNDCAVLLPLGAVVVAAAAAAVGKVERADDGLAAGLAAGLARAAPAARFVADEGRAEAAGLLLPLLLFRLLAAERIGCRGGVGVAAATVFLGEALFLGVGGGAVSVEKDGGSEPRGRLDSVAAVGDAGDVGLPDAETIVTTGADLRRGVSEDGAATDAEATAATACSVTAESCSQNELRTNSP
jgi:hypothetical protein